MSVTDRIGCGRERFRKFFQRETKSEKEGGGEKVEEERIKKDCGVRGGGITVNSVGDPTVYL